MAKSHINLSEAEQQELSSSLHRSDLKSKVFKRVTALLELHKGKSIEEVRKVLGLCYPTRLSSSTTINKAAWSA